MGLDEYVTKQKVEAAQANADSDMEGRPTDEHHKDNWVQKFVNNDIETKKIEGLFFCGTMGRFH